MNKIAFSSLTVRMVLIVTLLHLFLFGFLYFGLGRVIEEGYKSQFIDYVRADANNFAANLSGFGQQEMDVNTQAIEGAVLSGRTQYIQILTTEGKLVHSFGNINDNSLFVEDFNFGNGEDGIYHIAVTVYDENGMGIKRLRIGYDELFTKDKIDRTYYRVFLLSVIYIIVAFVATLFFSQRMTRPIRLLRQLTSKIAHGQYQTEIKVKTSISEIEELADTLEFMREELVAQSDSMKHLALHDHLTGLPNRVLLEDRVNQMLRLRGENQPPCILAIIDLDRFKEINDSFGHLVGDNVLIKTSLRLVNILRKSDTVARLGGDEFALLFPRTTSIAAITLAKKTISELEKPFNCDGHSVSLGASIGLAHYPEHGSCYEELFKKADIAMYAAKSSGVDIQVYQPSLNEDHLESLTMVTDLRTALESRNFFAVYQPKVCATTGDLMGVEALIRWQHPQRGLIPPIDFIHTAERSGLISQITQWVLEEAIKQSAAWQKMGLNISIAVNLSPINLVEENFKEGVLNLLDQYQLATAKLELEITESSFFADPIKAQEILTDLNNHGIEISIDDFGTGYSSLAQLKKMPVSTLKIDRSFVAHMHSNSSDSAIVSATINMAHELGLKVVAEGVEDFETLEKLRHYDCDIIQGYLISKPLIAKDFEYWYQHRMPIASS
ncbi:MAG: EAL domain-containing protein [Kangiellaceae bacterium]|nr:EAL domain-containing protein [Kangiellaceae bacterium]